MKRAFGVIVVACIACSDPIEPPAMDAATADAGPLPVDAGAVDAFDAGPFEPDPPAAPMPPQWACPEGWSVVEIEGVTTCAPPEGPTECAPGEARFIDEGACTPIAACPAGPFADVPTGAVYVTPNGTGSGGESDPTNLQAAINDARGETTIALGAGDYTISANLSDGTQLVGLCPSRTRLMPPVPVPQAVLGVRVGDTASISGLRIEAGGAIGIAAVGDMRVENVSIDGAGGAGVFVGEVASLVAHGLVVRGTTPDASNRGGAGVISDGDIEGSRWVLRRNTATGLFITMGTVDVSQLVSTHNTPVGTFDGGSALRMLAGELQLREADFRGATNFALQLEGGRATVEDLYIDELVSIPSPMAEVVGVGEDASLSLSRAFVRGEDWIVSAEDAMELRLADVLLVNRHFGDIFYAEHVGVVAIETPTSLERVAIIGGSSGILMNGPFNFDVALPGEPPLPPQERVPTEFRAQDLSISGVGLDVMRAYGITMDFHIDATLERVSIDGVRGTAVYSAGNFALRDARITDLLPGRNAFGTAIQLSGNDEGFAADPAIIERGHFEGLFDVGVNLNGRRARFDHVRVASTLRKPCADTECMDDPGGSAVAIVFDASLEAEHMLIDGADLCGVQFAFDSTLVLRNSRVRGTAIGACVQVDGYDLGMITDGVSYEDNGTNIESTMLAVPDAPAPPRL